MEKKFLKALTVGAVLSVGTPGVTLGAGGFGRWADPKTWDFARKFGAGFENARESWAKSREETFKRRQEQHAARMADLNKKANSKDLPKWQRDAARAAIDEEEARHRRSNEKRMAFEDQLDETAVKLGTNFAQGAMQEGFAQFAHERKLEEVGLEAAQRRKATVESTKEYIKAFTDPKNLGLFVLAASGVFASYFGLKHGITYIAEQYKKPDLADADKTSLKFGPVNYIKSLLTGTVNEESSLSDVILKPELAEEINEVTKSLKNIVANGGYFDNLMLWGQPGTGKTMLAMRMARACGLEYIYFTAGNLEPFSTEEASAQLVQLFRYAQNSPKKLMIIIDEAEKLLGSRGRGDVSDKKSTLLNLVLGYTGTESRDYMVTVMTNRPEDIDEAFLSRCGMRIQIGAPDKTERRAILQTYVDKFLIKASNLKPEKPSPLSAKYWFGKEQKVTPPTVEEGALSEETLDALSQRLDGFVGRDISKLVIQIQGAALATEDNRITSALVNRQVDRFIKAQEEKKRGFIRQGTNQGAPKAASAA